MNSSVKYFSLALQKEGDVGNVIFNENNDILVSKGNKVFSFLLCYIFSQKLY